MVIKAVADKISSVFVPAVCVIAAIDFCIWLAIDYTVLPSSWIPSGDGRWV